MSLVARHLEANGIPTVMLASARDIAESAFPPRAAFVNYPLGNTAGRPFDPANQRAIVEQALHVLETAPAAGTLVDTPHRWRQDEGWMERTYEEKHRDENH